VLEKAAMRGQTVLKSLPTGTSSDGGLLNFDKQGLSGVLDIPVYYNKLSEFIRSAAVNHRNASVDWRTKEGYGRPKISSMLTGEVDKGDENSGIKTCVELAQDRAKYIWAQKEDDRLIKALLTASSLSREACKALEPLKGQLAATKQVLSGGEENLVVELHTKGEVDAKDIEKMQRGLQSSMDAATAAQSEIKTHLNTINEDCVKRPSIITGLERCITRVCDLVNDDTEWVLSLNFDQLEVSLQSALGAPYRA
jgi:hypothetical protein